MTDLFRLDCECGCAAKLPPDRLAGILRNLDLPSCPELIIGPETLDDAGVYKISDDQCLAQTVDFFPPVARDPYVYGQIAAANSLSDVYAMGGKPLTAMAIVCFPAKALELEVLRQITEGALSKLREAGAVLLGGHSIVDQQPKYGLAVTGVVHPDRIMGNAYAAPGDVLILTKPLGTGVTIMAAKAGMAGEQDEEAANRSMCALNAKASVIAAEHEVRACTDITGFGFLGHAMQMANASGVCMAINVRAIPRLEGALEYAGMGLLPGAAYANRKYVGENVVFADDVTLAEQDLLFDPQTSGGLLISCPRAEAQAVLAKLQKHLPTSCDIVGEVTEKAGGAVIQVKKEEK